MTSSSFDQISNPDELLRSLKDLKNSLIGNVARKVDVAGDGRTIKCLLDQLRPLSTPTSLAQSTSTPLPNLSSKALEIANESAVILSSFASIGNLILVSLLDHQVDFILLEYLRALIPFVHSSDGQFQGLHKGAELTVEAINYLLQKLIPNLCKALRNILHAAGEAVFGHMTGVGVEVEVIQTGWAMAAPANCSGFESRAGVMGSTVGMPSAGSMLDGVSKMRVPSIVPVRGLGELARGSVLRLFEAGNIELLWSLITDPRTASQATLLPVYQLLAQLTLLPSQRAMLMSVSLPPTSIESLNEDLGEIRPTSFPPPAQADPIASTSSRTPSPTSPSAATTPVVSHVRPSCLIESITNVVLSGSTNVKVKRAGLDLLASLTRDESGVSLEVFGALKERPPDQQDRRARVSVELPGYEALYPLVDMMESRTIGLASSAIICLTNVLKAIPVPIVWSGADRLGDTSATAQRLSPAMPVNVFPTLKYLLDRGQEERIRATFTLAKLISDSPALQKRANKEDCCVCVLDALTSSPENGSAEQMTGNTKSRLAQGCYLSLAALAMNDQSSRSAIADSEVLAQVKTSLSHETYGMRAAACQLVRAISRSTAILRTNLVDSGVGEEVIKLLVREENHAQEGDHAMSGRIPSSRQDTVLIAATATICNLSTEFSPVQRLIVDSGAIKALARLSSNTSTMVRVNSLWALRNLIYQSDMDIKRKVMDSLTWNGLTQLAVDASAEVREQAFALLRNLISEATEEQIDFVMRGIGEDTVFSLVYSGISRPEEPELTEEVLYVLNNIALGTKANREAIFSRPALLFLMCRTLSSSNSMVRLAALTAFSSLLDSAHKHNRPKSDEIAKLEGLGLLVNVKALCSASTFDVRKAARDLLVHLESAGAGK